MVGVFIRPLDKKLFEIEIFQFFGIFAIWNYQTTKTDTNWANFYSDQETCKIVLG